MRKRLKVEVISCRECGITNLDGDSELGISAPVIEPREAAGGETLCEDCAAQYEDEDSEE